MENTTNVDAWLEEGYNLFAAEGVSGIQIERLARILQLNKSGFYHYFGDMEGYWTELLHLHDKRAIDFMDELREIATIEPDYFELVVRYKVPVMFQMQLRRSQDKYALFHKAAGRLDQKSSEILNPLWSRYLGVEDNPDLALRYFEIVRDMFYARITFKEFDYSFLKRLVTEAKVVMQQIADSNLQRTETQTVN